jgi:hypothetical protein
MMERVRERDFNLLVCWEEYIEATADAIGNGIYRLIDQYTKVASMIASKSIPFALRCTPEYGKVFPDNAHRCSNCLE